MQHLEVSGTPVLYIGRKVLKGQPVTLGRRFRCCEATRRGDAEKVSNKIWAERNREYSDMQRGMYNI